VSKRNPARGLLVVVLAILVAGCSKGLKYKPGCYLGDTIHPADRANIEQAAARFYQLLRSFSYDTAYDEASPQLQRLYPRDQLTSIWASINETLTIPDHLDLEDMALVAIREGARGPQSVPCIGADSAAARTMSATDQPYQAYLVESGAVGNNVYTYASVWYYEDGVWKMASFGAKPKIQNGHDWTWYRDLSREQKELGNRRNAALLLNMAMDLLIPAPWIRPEEVRRLEKEQHAIAVVELPVGRPLDWVARDSTVFHPYLVQPHVTENGFGLTFAYEVTNTDTAAVRANAPKLASFIKTTFPEYKDLFRDLTLEAYTKPDHRPVWRSEFSFQDGP